MVAKALFKWSNKITTSQVEQLLRAEKDVQKALRIFDSATAEYSNGYKHDRSTFHIMISKLLTANKFRLAEEMLSRMKVEKCRITEDIFLSICMAYGRGLCQSEKVDEAMGLFEKMKTNGVEPNVFTYSSLMDGLCKNGRSKQAMELLHLMVMKRVKPNTITYTTLITGLCKEGKILEAVAILDRMKLQELKPDAGLYGKVITELCGLKRFQEAANFLDEMVLGRITPS
ncbi:unnamed protein product [Linum tenue]|uniref:Pentatricopeptide repeat-containing protein n=1 Tax=Linum tenue TaxID=586396 RepID=A0AAV0PF25_9ROSI|nr:unnamed protein product [Linum tenue]